jgi:NAD(P)-dependent dehydrogenase (short-subunit alcohol dehydrogenase family)
MDLNGRDAMQRVFITGASSGIGAALAAAYARQGAVLGLVARRRDKLEQLRTGLAHPERHHLYVLDVTDHAALQQAAQDFLASTGGIEVVIANAGISQGTLTEFAEDIPVFERIIATNVTATVATFHPFIAAMKEQMKEQMKEKTNAQPQLQNCRLVGIGSVAGIRGLPGAEAYSASKAAVISYCESLRLELKPHGIDVVTDFAGLHRHADDPEEPLPHAFPDAGRSALPPVPPM